MADLILRAAAVAQIKENYCDWCDHTDLCPSCETRDCIATIEQQVPAVDAAPVVRCRDCKHRDPEDKKCDYGGMAVQGLFFPRPDDWYCADGERRDSE